MIKAKGLQDAAKKSVINVGRDANLKEIFGGAESIPMTRIMKVRRRRARALKWLLGGSSQSKRLRDLGCARLCTLRLFHQPLSCPHRTSLLRLRAACRTSSRTSRRWRSPPPLRLPTSSRELEAEPSRRTQGLPVQARRRPPLWKLSPAVPRRRCSSRSLGPPLAPLDRRRRSSLDCHRSCCCRMRCATDATDARAQDQVTHS